jgi:hypothetical protein
MTTTNSTTKSNSNGGSHFGDTVQEWGVFQVDFFERTPPKHKKTQPKSAVKKSAFC